LIARIGAETATGIAPAARRTPRNQSRSARAIASTVTRASSSSGRE
jgi:hypothetical protein